MQEKTFVFDKKSHIWIYGHGFLGVPLFHKLLNQGYCVEGFIDRNAKTLQKEKSYIIVDPNYLDKVAKDDVIVLTFQNIQEHEKAAYQLCKKGYQKIIYLYENTKYYPQTFDNFNSLVYGTKEEEFVFPETSLNVQVRKSTKYIREYSDYVIFYAPIQIVFSAPLEPPFDFGKTMDKDTVYFNYPLSSICEYDALFSMYLYGNCECKYLDRYVSRLKGNARTTEEFLQGRLSLCDRMMQKFSENGMAFFQNAPPHVKLDINKKILVLTDGHHRAAFLTAMHQNFIPVRLNKSSYDIWLNDKEAKTVSRLIQKNGIILYTPILHPRFFNNYSITERYGCLNAKAITRFFLHYNLREYSVLDYNSNISYYSRIFFRLGAKEIVSIEKRAQLSELALEINRLEGCNDIILSDKPDHKFDIVLYMNDTVTEIENDSVLFDRTIVELDEMCNKFLVIKLNNDGKKAEKKILTIASFSKSICVNMEIKNGHRTEVLIFEKI